MRDTIVEKKVHSSIFQDERQKPGLAAEDYIVTIPLEDGDVCDC